MIRGDQTNPDGGSRETPVEITYILPNTCARRGGYDVEQDGGHVRVTVFNLEPADSRIQFDKADLTRYHSILLKGLEAGQDITVSANGTERKLLAP